MTPPGLLLLEELVKRLPEERERLLAYELRRRERERELYLAGKRLLQVNIWGALRAMLVVGSMVFALIWTLGAIAQFNAWFEGIRTQSVTLPVPIGDDLRLDVGKLIPRPSSTLLIWAASLPLWNTADASTIAILAMLVVAIEKSVIAYLTWTHAKKLDGAAKELKEEIEVLKEWMAADPPPQRRG